MWFSKVTRGVMKSFRYPLATKITVHKRHACLSFTSTSLNRTIKSRDKPLLSFPCRGFANDNQANKDDQIHIEELKVLFKDDPQLQSWLAELSATNSTQSENISKNDIVLNEAPNENVIDIDREMARYNIEEFYDNEFDSTQENSEDELQEYHQLPISSERGQTGVFDVEELVDLIRSEKGQDICVIKVPPKITYVDYLVLVTGRSTRHLRAMAFYIKWAFKQKRADRDPKTCKIEGLQSRDWLAIDLGNIALHLMQAETRNNYDIETLWTVGPEYDDKLIDLEDPFVDLFAFYEERDESIPKPSEENLLTLSTKADYIYPKEEKTHVEHKYGNPLEAEGMESVAGWHSVKQRSAKEKDNK